jgi:hypothetical protein
MPLPGAATAPGIAPTPPIAIAVAGEPRVVTGEWAPPPKRSLRPLLLGAGIGLLVITLLLIAVTLLGDKSAPASRSPVSSSASARVVAPPLTNLPTLLPTASGSSVAAENAASDDVTPPPPPAVAPKKSPLPVAAPKKSPAPTTPEKPAARSTGSDLGF